MDFCEANYGAPAIRIIREAVRQFIDESLENEPALRKRFEEARLKRLKASKPISVVKGRNEDG